MHLLNETDELLKKVNELGIPKRFTFWKRYMRDYVAFEAGETVFQAEEMPEGFYFLLIGKMRIYSLNKQGNVRQIAIATSEKEVVGTGKIVSLLPVLGDVEFLQRIPSPNHVESVSNSVFLRVRYDFAQMEEDLALFKFLAYSMEKKMESSSKDLTDVYRPLKERFADYLAAASDHGIFQGNYLEAAECLGCSYRQLMRIVSEMYREGSLVKTGKTIKVYLNQNKSFE